MTKDTGEEDRQPKSTLAKESSTKNEGAIFNYEASSSPSLLFSYAKRYFSGLSNPAPLVSGSQNAASDVPVDSFMSSPRATKQEVHLSKEQQEFEALKKVHHKTASELSRCATHCSKLISQSEQDQIAIKDLRRTVQNLQADMEHEADRFQAKIHELQKTLQSANEGHEKLQKQFLQLKTEISSSTRIGNHMTDEEVRNEINDIYHQLQGWAVNVVRYVKSGTLTFYDVPNGEWLNLLMPRFQKNPDSTYSMNICMAAVSYVLLKFFNSHLAFGCNEDGTKSSITNFALKIRGNDGPRLSQQVHKDYKRWVDLTQKLVVAQIPSDAEGSSRATARAGMRAALNELFKVSSINSLSQELCEDLYGIMQAFVAFSQAMEAHPAEFAMTIPSALEVSVRRRRRFRPTEMEDQTGLEDDELPGAVLVGSMFPALIKIRNERGEKIDDLYVSKAKVMAQPK